MQQKSRNTWSKRKEKIPCLSFLCDPWFHRSPSFTCIRRALASATASCNFRKCVHPNCVRSADTILISGNTSANRIMRNRLRVANPRPNSCVNCVPSADTIRSPYSARFSWRMSRRMRRPICQYNVVSVAFTLLATDCRAATIISRTSTSRTLASPADANDTDLADRTLSFHIALSSWTNCSFTGRCLRPAEWWICPSYSRQVTR